MLGTYPVIDVISCALSADITTKVKKVVGDAVKVEVDEYGEGAKIFVNDVDYLTLKSFIEIEDDFLVNKEVPYDADNMNIDELTFIKINNIMLGYIDNIDKCIKVGMCLVAVLNKTTLEVVDNLFLPLGNGLFSDSIYNVINKDKTASDDKVFYQVVEIKNYVFSRSILVNTDPTRVFRFPKKLI